ncbi:MAG: TIGR03435 family protein [Vicinamibacterales bacterium]
MLRRIAIALVLIAGVGTTAVRAQHSFDVASIRQNKSGDPRSSANILPGKRFVATNMRLVDLIAYAYGIPRAMQRYLLLTPLNNVLSARFDISAAAAPDAPPERELAMLQALLVERFNLKTHVEVRPVPVYALTVVRPDRLGPGLRPSVYNCTQYLIAKRSRADVAEPREAKTGRSWCAGSTDMRAPGAISFRAADDVAEFIRDLQGWVDRPIVDRTGLRGNYEWHLTFSYDRRPNNRSPEVYIALQEQLGLKLEPVRESREVRLVDAVKMPRPN